MSRISHHLARLQQLLARVYVAEDEASTVKVSKRAKVISVCMAVCAITLLASLATSGQTSSATFGFLVGFTALMLLGDLAAQTRGESGIMITFSFPVAMSAMVLYGPDWRILAAASMASSIACVARPAVTGGRWGNLFNSSLMVLDTAAAGATVLLMRDHLPLVPLVVAAAAASLLVNNGLLAVVPTGHFSIRERLTMVVSSDWRYLGFNIPFIILGFLAMGVDPLLGLLGLSGPMVLALLTTRPHEQLEIARLHLARDGMTGLYNKQALWTLLHDMPNQEPAEFALLLLDIDNFKILNDTHGHLEGDIALKSVASAVEHAVRDTDFVARFGGEEFAVVFPPDVSADVVLARSERIREACAVALDRWETTVSIGVAMGTTSISHPEELMKEADEALYHAKRTGKDRVVVAGGYERVDASAA